MEEATGAPSSFAVSDPKRLRASGRDGQTVMTEPPSPLRMLLSRHTKLLRSANLHNWRFMEEQVIAGLRSLLAKILAEYDLWRLPTEERRRNVVRGSLRLVRPCKTANGSL